MFISKLNENIYLKVQRLNSDDILFDVIYKEEHLCRKIFYADRTIRTYQIKPYEYNERVYKGLINHDVLDIIKKEFKRYEKIQKL